MDTVTHLAAQKVVVPGGRLLQRCAICGAKLIDIDPRFTASVEGSGPPVGWTPNRLVRCSVGVNPQTWELLDETDQLPLDACLPLVEA